MWFITAVVHGAVDHEAWLFVVTESEMTDKMDLGSD